MKVSVMLSVNIFVRHARKLQLEDQSFVAARRHVLILHILKMNHPSNGEK
jgi:ABC-type iron transport system FetAB permease component